MPGFLSRLVRTLLDISGLFFHPISVLNINYPAHKSLKELCTTLIGRLHSTKAHIWREFDIFHYFLPRVSVPTVLAQMLALGPITVLERNGLLFLLVYPVFTYLSRNECDR